MAMEVFILLYTKNLLKNMIGEYRLMELVLFLEDIKEFLGVGVKIRQSSTGKDFVIQINGSCQLNRVLGTIYQDSEENIRLNRKYEKYQKFLQDFGCISLEPVNTGCALDDVVDTGNGVEQEC